MSVELIMTGDESGAALVDFAQKTADRLVKARLTRTQMRSIFTEIRQIEALWSIDPVKAQRRLNLLKPKLDYQTNRYQQVQGLRDVLSEAIGFVERSPDQPVREERFHRLVDLFEAILAYHRAKGGRN